jgi:hypothetical protein
LSFSQQINFPNWQYAASTVMKSYDATASGFKHPGEPISWPQTECAARWMRDVPALLVTGRDLAGIDELQHLSDDDLARIEQALPLAA